MTNNSSSHLLLHSIYNRLIFLIQLPYHLIFHKQMYGFNRGFVLCEEPCGYCYDAYYHQMGCEQCYCIITKQQSGENV